MRLSFQTSSYYCTYKVHHQSQLLLPSPIRPPPTITTTTTTLRRPTKCLLRPPSSSAAAANAKEKIIVIMGATGSGKSRLSVDLAARFFPSSEIINSDKMQVYRGLDITTNKIPLPDRRGVPHHLLGVIDPSVGDVSPAHFRLLARAAISDILSRNNLPLIVGGSNSFIHALVTNRVDSAESDTELTNSADLHYDCCFLWVDVAFPVLCQYLLKRVDDMFDSGMLAELAEFYDSLDDSVLKPCVGLRKAIGVPEFAQYFRRFPASLRGAAAVGGGGGGGMMGTGIEVDVGREVEFAEAVEGIKYNTCQLAMKQMRKIERLRGGVGGWELRRLNATEFFRAVMGGERRASEEIWERKVLLPSVKVVKSFLAG